MATITITIPDDQVDVVTEAAITRPPTNMAYTGDPTDTAAKLVFLTNVIITMINQDVYAYQCNKAITDAQMTAAQNVPQIVVPSV